jgi:hypothetical protein
VFPLDVNPLFNCTLSLDVSPMEEPLDLNPLFNFTLSLDVSPTNEQDKQPVKLMYYEVGDGAQTVYGVAIGAERHFEVLLKSEDVCAQ